MPETLASQRASLRRRLGPWGAWSFGFAYAPAAPARSAAQTIEANGYGCIWFPETLDSYEAYTNAGVLLAATENIMVATDAAAFAVKYLAAFEGVAARAGQGSLVIADTDAARRRLEMIRNLIMLGEEADVAQQLGKLRPVAEALQLERIIDALDKGEYRLALEAIETYLGRATAIVVTGQYEIPRLRLQLEALELRLESMSDEKAEQERRLITFNRRHDDALGGLIQRVLKARAVLARQLAVCSGQVF